MKARTPVLPPDLHPRSPFWAAAAPLLLTIDATELARRQLDGLVDLLGLRSGDAVLDLQCAANGNVALDLARRGMHVTTVAFNPALGNLTRRRAAAADLTVDVVVAEDPRWIDPVGEVAAVLDLGSPFGVADSLPEPAALLSQAAGRLTGGGHLVVLTMGAEVALRDYIGRDWYEHGDRLVLLESEPLDEWTRLEHRWRIYEGDDHTDLRFEHRLLTARQLQQLLREAGMTACEVHGCDVDGTPRRAPYDRTAHRLLAVGRR